MRKALPRECLTPRQPGGGYERENGRPGAPRQQATGKAMIDNFALGLSHVLMMIAAIMLLRRHDLDREPGAGGDDRRA